MVRQGNIIVIFLFKMVFINAVIRKALMNSFLSLMSINIKYILKHQLEHFR